MSTNEPLEERSTDRSLVERLFGAQPPTVSGIDPDGLFALLSSARRRRALLVLHIDGALSIRDLAGVQGGNEESTPPDQLTDKQYKRHYVSLYQTHLPRLEAAGLVTIDGDDVALTNRGERVAAFLRFFEREIYGGESA